MIASNRLACSDILAQMAADDPFHLVRRELAGGVLCQRKVAGRYRGPGLQHPRRNNATPAGKACFGGQASAAEHLLCFSNCCRLPCSRDHKHCTCGNCKVRARAFIADGQKGLRCNPGQCANVSTTMYQQQAATALQRDAPPRRGALAAAKRKLVPARRAGDFFQCRAACAQCRRQSAAGGDLYKLAVRDFVGRQNQQVRFNVRICGDFNVYRPQMCPVRRANDSVNAGIELAARRFAGEDQAGMGEADNAHFFNVIGA